MCVLCWHCCASAAAEKGFAAVAFKQPCAQLLLCVCVQRVVALFVVSAWWFGLKGEGKQIEPLPILSEERLSSDSAKARARRPATATNNHTTTHTPLFDQTLAIDIGLQPTPPTHRSERRATPTRKRQLISQTPRQITTAKAKVSSSFHAIQSETCPASLIRALELLTRLLVAFPRYATSLSPALSPAIVHASFLPSFHSIDSWLHCIWPSFYSSIAIWRVNHHRQLVMYAHTQPPPRTQLDDLEYPSEYSVATAKQQSAALRAKQAQEASYEYQLHNGDSSSYLSASRSTASTPASRNQQQSSHLQPSIEMSDSESIATAQHRTAIAIWGNRVKICFVLHLITALCILHSFYCTDSVADTSAGGLLLRC